MPDSWDRQGTRRLDWETVSLRPLHSSLQRGICPFPIPKTNWEADFASTQPERHLNGTA